METAIISQPLTVPISNLENEPWNLQFRTWLFNRKPRLSEKSIILAEQHIRVFAKWHEAKFNETFHPGAVTNYDLHLYRSQSLDIKKVKAATWNSRHWALDLLCQWINLPELMDDIETKEAGRASTKHRSLTDNEYHRLIHALETNPRRAVTQFEYLNTVRDYAAAMLMLHGLRVEEVALLESCDITINERSGEVRVRNGKGSKERCVPLNKIGRKAVSAWLGERAENATALDLFEGRTTRSLQRDICSLGSQIAVPDLTPHWLRYTFAKRLEQNGTPIEQIRDLLGHNTIETTRRYLRSSAEELQSAVEGVM